MRRSVLIVLLSLGTVGGFLHGCARLAHLHGRGPFAAHTGGHRQGLEDHVADVCLRAAARNAEGRAAPAPKP